MAEPVTPLTPAELAVLERILGQAPGGAQLLDGLPVAAAPTPGVAEITTRPPLVSFLTTKIPPPSPFYLAAEDVIQVEVWNSVTAATITLGARLLRPDGVIIPVTRDYKPATDRSRSVFTLTLGEGFLLGLQFGTSTVAQPGLCFVLATVIRPQFPAGTNLATLVSGYVTNTLRPGWPITPPRDPREGPGAFLFIIGTQPPAGTDWTVTVPTNARWRVQWVQNGLTTSAVAGNRYPRFGFFRSPFLEAFVAPAVGQPPSVNWSWAWGEGLSSLGQAGANMVHNPLVAGMTLIAGDQLVASTIGLQGGDVWISPGVAVQEWIDV